VVKGDDGGLSRKALWHGRASRGGAHWFRKYRLGAKTALGILGRCETEGKRMDAMSRTGKETLIWGSQSIRRTNGKEVPPRREVGGGWAYGHGWALAGPFHYPWMGNGFER